MFKGIERSDSQLESDIKNEMDWDPSFTSTDVRITTKDGLVTLSGSIPHNAERFRAELAAQRVAGVRMVVDQLEVAPLGHSQPDDGDIGRAAIQALQWNSQVPDTVKVSIQKGWITLRGSTQWDFQRKSAVKAVESLIGVLGVHNDLILQSADVAVDVKSRIEEALKRSAITEGQNINVIVTGGIAVLNGTVNSLSESEDACLAAFNATGVMQVHNNLQIAA
ncbi:MAG: BON domain-containing protein [Chitinophagaceae bacterium]|nr:BON domain-containing protein [Oligoflexus sp.]